MIPAGSAFLAKLLAMRRHFCGLCCLSLCCISAPLLAAERVAVLVANNVGIAGEVPLQHTGADARRLAAVLTELGHFAADDIVIITEQTADTVLRVLRDMTARTDVKMLFFYYSGHADASSLHLRGTRLALTTLLESLAAAKSPLQLLLLDACQSGAVSRTKGSTVGPAFDVRVIEPPIAGQIIITSSAADEQSYESEIQRGALFSTHWISALRGAADRNGDGQVTLGEAYHYAYAQTLRDTLMSGAGPQHPSFRWGYSARQEPVLTYLRSDTRITLQSSRDGVFVVFTASERDVMAEVPLRAGEQVHLTLAAGDYVIKKHDTEAMRAAQVRLAAGDDRVLYDRSMAPVPLLRLARKGTWGELALLAGVGQYATALGPRGVLQGSVGAVMSHHETSLVARLLFSTGMENHQGLPTQTSYVGPEVAWLWRFELGPFLHTGVGPLAGALYWQQHSFGHDTVHSTAGLLGVQGVIQTYVLPRVALGARLDAGYLAVRTNDPLPIASLRIGDVGLLPWLAYNVEIQFDW